ncbi:hypothetical protein [uncultured Kingella sp.]|uniref:hypothetical protein n=1 Tax=uncultured Kingella sp. TaxID=159270 RepID=UPI00259195A3|nr:hypothetical protein [uncultured Kingella sp.]
MSFPDKGFGVSGCLKATVVWVFASWVGRAFMFQYPVFRLPLMPSENQKGSLKPNIQTVRASFGL